MAEFIVNPRRAPRAPARCRAAVASPTGSFEAETEDIGARGCHLVSPKRVKQDDAVRITIANDEVPVPLQVAGRVAWVSAQFPWHVGIAFDEAALPETTAWYGRLVEAHPGMRTLKRLPERIPVSAPVYLGQPPRFVVDFSADEAALLRGIGSGARVDDLMVRFRERGDAMERALFSLIARSAVTLVRGQAVHPSAWKSVLDEVEASLAADSLGSGSFSLAAPPEEPGATPEPAATPVPAAPTVPAAIPPPAAPFASSPSAPPSPERARAGDGTELPGSFPPAESPFGKPPLGPGLGLELQEDSGPVIEVEEPTPRGARRAVDAGADWGRGPAPSAVPHAPDHDGRGVGWRKGGGSRPGEAQAIFDRARAEFLAGNVNGAIALLRRALALAPGDSEIADVLGKLAFRDRDPGAR